MKKHNLFFYSFVAGITIIHLFAYRVWLFSSGILSHGDWMLSLPNYSKSLLSVPIIWKSYAIGSIDLTPPFYIFLLLEGILSNLGLSYGYIERITFFWPIAILTIPISYFFIKYLVQNRLAALVGALVYAYNTYFFIIQTGHLTLMVGFALAPLVIVLFMQSLEKKSLQHALLCGLVTFVISFYEFRAFYLVTLIALSYYLYFIFSLSTEKAFMTIKKTFLYAVIPLIIVGVFNIYWILPYMFATVSIEGAVFNRALFGKEFFDINTAFTAFHPFWTGGKYFPFITQPIPFYFFLTPLLAFTGLYLNRKNKKILFFGLLTLVGIFLAKQNNVPFPDVYMWLYLYFPGFGAFREASKFYFIIALGYSVLMGALISWVWAHWNNGIYQKLKYGVVIFVVLLNIWNLKPLVTGSFDTLFVTRTMPTEYESFNSYIDSQNTFFRTLWLPSDSRWGSNTDLHPRVGAANMASGIWKDVDKSGDYPSLGEKFIAFYALPESAQLLNVTSIKYIIIPKIDKANDDNFFELFGKDRSEYIKTLDKVSHLKKVDDYNGSIIVYENTSVKPHLYTTEIPESITKDIEYKGVTSEKITNAQYHIKIENITKPFYLHFADSYHPDWRLRVGDFNWLDVLGDKKYFMPANIHTKNNAKLNSYFIDPKTLDGGKVITNKDGSITLNMTLYFVPQTYTYIGTMISAVSFVSVIILLSVTTIRRKKYAKTK